jgi:hypothetical protein
VIEQVPGCRQAILLERLADGDAHESVAFLCGGPAVVADLFDDGVDVGDHPADDDGNVLGRILVEDLGERSDVRVRQQVEASLPRGVLAVPGGGDVAGEGEQFAQVIDGVAGLRERSFAQFFQPLGQGPVDLVLTVGAGEPAPYVSALS